MSQRRLGNWLISLQVAPLLITAQMVHAQIQNGGFETGNLTGWTATPGSSVEVLQASNFNPVITPPQGSRFCLLSTNAGVAGPQDLDGNGTPEYHISTLSQTFTMATVPASISFAWCFITSEQNWGPVYDDIFQVTLNSEVLLRRSSYKPGGISPWSDTQTYLAGNYTVTSTGPTDGSNYDDGRTGFATICVFISQPGTYTLTFQIADQYDSAYDSGLLIDDVQAPSTCTPTIGQITATSGADVQLKSGGFVFTQAFSRTVGMSAIGLVMAFVSNANLTGDNPNLQTQEFAYANGVFERLTSMTDKTAGRPSVTSTGRFVAFASTADLTPGSPGNADGNWEIFRWDRNLRQTRQITNTIGTCANLNPSIAGDNTGSRIAFQSTCTPHGTYSNADGNEEVVLWDQTSGFSGTNTATPCRNIDPSINRVGGRYVAFGTNCSIGGGNTDRNWEIYRWDTSGGTFAQVTNSTTVGTPAVVVANSSPSISGDGSYVAFVGSGAYNGNTDGNMEAWRWQSPNTFLRLTTTDTPLTFHTIASLGDDPRHIAAERFNALTFASEVLQIDATNVSNPTIVASNANMPGIGYVGSTPVVAFQSSQNFTGGNTDLNDEICTSTTAVGTRRVFCQSHEPALAIPDNNSTGVNSTLTVGDTPTIADLDVFVQINHTNVGDLYVTLTHGATTVVLIDRPGWTSGGGAGCTRDNVQATLDDEATTGYVESQCVASVPTIYGTFRPGTGTPVSPLTAFDGQALNGDWVLNVSDRRNSNTGTLVKWCLLAQTN